MNKANLAKSLNDAVAHHQRGDLAKAEALYRGILQADPGHFDALHLLGVLADQCGSRPQGIALVRQALSIQPRSAEAQFNMGRMLSAEGDSTGARQYLAQAIALKPTLAQAHMEMGNLYRRQGAYADAATSFENTIRHAPKLIEAYINLCNTYRDSGEEEKIIDVADRGLRIDPRNASLWLLRAEAAFTTGRLADGWRDYNWRFSTADRPVDTPHYPLPKWNGESLTGKGILIWCEQGVGDEIIYANMLAGMAAAAQRCVLHTTPRLAPLFARSFPGMAIYAGQVPTDVASALDFQVAMGSMGQWRRTSFNAFPSATDYLKADPGKTTALREKYRRGTNTLLVGIAWGSVGTFNGTVVSNAAEKTIRLGQWGAILSVPGVTFVNLQYGSNTAEIAAAREAFKATIIEDTTIDNLSDLDGFAAQVAAMDLVISSSNTAAHMAGALGVPTWCMVPRTLTGGRRWYWFGAGNYAPWYRAMTLFRQTGQGWVPVIADVALCLVTAATQRGLIPNPGAYLDGLARGYKTAKLEHEAEKARVHMAVLAPSAATLLDAAEIEFKNNALSAALAHTTAAIALPDAPAEAFNTHGRVLARLDRCDEAITAYRESLARKPGVAEVLNNLGTSLRRIGRSGEALSCYAQAIAQKPDHPAILLNYATVLAENNRLDEALAVYEKLVALEPEYADAQYNRATTLLNAGRFAEGWKAFRWRLRRANVHVRHEDFPHPVWAGEDLAGKHVLIWTDLGIGEEVLTASLLPDAIKAARRVTFLCSGRTSSLFRRSFAGAIVDVRAAPLPTTALSKNIDFQMSAAELGAVFRPRFDAFPPRNVFLKPDERLRERLRAKYLAGRAQPKLVGICWRSVHPDIGRQKSIPLSQWLPILETPGLTFVNLQYGDCGVELDALRREHGIDIIDDRDIDFFGDLDPVAAQIAAMDLVISVSNTAVHLAGGTGIKTWAMVPPGQGRLWYWFRNTTQSHWYPSVTLHTPQGDDGWPDLLAKIGNDTKQWAETSRG